MTTLDPTVAFAPATHTRWWRQLAKATMKAMLPRSAFLTHGPRSSSHICLTFDDGPHPEHTPRVLDALAAYDVRATFFLIGEQAARHPDLVRRIARAGHVIGHHSYFHTPPELTSGAQLGMEARRTSSLLSDLLGRRVHLFRPPHGKLSPGKLSRLWLQGQTVVLWSLDPKDFACAGAQGILDYFREHPTRGGDIVLLHDAFPYAWAVVGRLVSEARGRGLDFTTVDHWTNRS